MPGAAQMGPNAVQNPQALMAALQQQQPAPNPQTPAERLNPDQQALEHIKAAQVSLDRARAYTNDQHMLAVLDAMAGVLTKALLKFDGSAIISAYVDGAQALSPMLASAPGMQPPGAAGPMGGPPQGGPMPAGAPPQGVPLQ